MSDVNDLASRLENVIVRAKEKKKQEQQSRLQEFMERRKLLVEYDKAQARVVELAKPRLETLAKVAGDKATVTPTVTQTRRTAKFEFRSPKAYIILTFAVAPDAAVRNVIVDCDTSIVPCCGSSTRTRNSRPRLRPLTRPTCKSGSTNASSSSPSCTSASIRAKSSKRPSTSKTPVMKIQFPKFAAGATLDHAGQTYYFVDDTTRAEFAAQKGAKFP